MQKHAVIGATALLFLCGSLARADWLTPIAGGKPILPSRFISGFASPNVVAPLASLALVREKTEPAGTLLPSDPDEPDMPAVDVHVRWIPLVDKVLSQSQRGADLSGDLLNAIMRIEPIYDPTRLGGPSETAPFAISPGTAAMNNVFADRWQVADSDPNVNVKVAYVAAAWQRQGDLPCDAFTKNRAHGEGVPALTALSQADCQRIRARAALGFRDPPPIPIVTARLSVPVFAAPMPGSRMSSKDFWAAQRARIAAIEASLHTRVKAHLAKGETPQRLASDTKVRR